MGAVQQMLMGVTPAAGAAAPTSWSFTYSSLSSAVPTQASLSDGSSLTFFANNSPADSPPFLRADFGSVATLSSVSYRAARGADGWGTSFTNGRDIQYSIDGSAWTTATTISGSSESTNSTFTFGTPVSARYVRITASSGYVALSEFLFA